MRIRGFKEPNSIAGAQEISNNRLFFNHCNAFSYMKLEFQVQENQPLLQVLVMDHLPHLRRSEYLQDDLKFVRPGINC